MTASSNDLGEVVRELLKAGADPNILNKVSNIISHCSTSQSIFYHRLVRQRMK